MGLRLTLENDASIPDEEPLYRGIHPHFVNAGAVSSAAFISRPDPHISVDRSSLSSPEATLRRHAGYAGVAWVSAGSVRTVTVGVASDPLPQNPAHALIIRDPAMTHGMWKKVARTLAKACTWVLGP